MTHPYSPEVQAAVERACQIARAACEPYLGAPLTEEGKAAMRKAADEVCESLNAITQGGVESVEVDEARGELHCRVRVPAGLFPPGTFDELEQIHD